MINKKYEELDSISKALIQLSEGIIPGKLGKSASDEINNLIDGINKLIENTEQTRIFINSLLKNDCNIHFQSGKSLLPLPLKELHLKLSESEKKLYDCKKAKDKLFSIISHDIRGPIGSVYQFLKYISVNYKNFSPDDIIEVLTGMKNSTKVVFDTLDNLFLWARIQSNRMDYEPEKLNLVEFLLESKNFFQKQADNKELKINILISPGIAIFADKESFMILVKNLISNSIKFSHKGGNIDIKSELNEKNKKVIIKFIDYGTGISEKILNLLFSVERKVSAPGTAGEKGSGLGLLLCKELVEMNGGEITLDTKENYGTIATITLPVAE